MRMLKKLLLAGAFIGVLGSFGFAQEAKADTIDKAEINGDKLSYIVTSTTSENSISILIDGIDSGYKQTVSAGTVSRNDISVKELVNGMVGSIKSKTDVKTLTVKTSGTAAASKDATGMKAMYRIIGQSNNDSWGSVTVDKKVCVFDYKQGDGGVSHTVEAEPKYGYTFSKWDDGDTDKSGTRTVYATTGIPIAATFKETLKGPYILATVTHVDGTVVNYNTDEGDTDCYMEVGDTLHLQYNKPTGADKATIIDGEGTAGKFASFFTSAGTNKYRATKETPDTEYVTVTGQATYGTDKVLGDSLDIYIGKGSVATKVTLSDFKDKNYITGGYTIEFKAKADNGSKNITVEFTENGDFVDGDPSVSTDSSNEYYATIKIKFKSDKVDKGNNSKDVKFRIKVDGVVASIANKDETTTSTDKTITVYSNPKNSYDTTNGMSYEVPSKVNTGSESGKDSNVDYTKDEPFDVKGARLNVLVSDSVLGTTTTAGSSGVKSSINASTMDTVITNLGKNGKLTGNCTAALRVYPCDSNQKVNKKVYHECYVDVRKIVVKVTSGSSASGSGSAKVSDLPLAIINPTDNLVAAARSTTTTTTTTSSTEKTYVAYGIVGRQVKWPDDFVEEKNRTAPTSEEKTITVNGNPLSSITVKSVDSENIYSGVAGARAASDSTGLDKVPRTGQSNVFVYVMAVVICGAVGYGLYVYNKKSRKSI